MSYITIYLAISRPFLVPVTGSRNFSSDVYGGLLTYEIYIIIQDVASFQKMSANIEDNIFIIEKIALSSFLEQSSRLKLKEVSDKIMEEIKCHRYKEIYFQMVWKLQWDRKLSPSYPQT